MAQIKIEVVYDPAKETLPQAISSLLGEAHACKCASKPAQEFEQTMIPEFMATPKRKPEVTTAAEVKAEVTTAAEATATTEAPAKTKRPDSMKTDIRALALALSKSDKAKLKEILQSFGATKLSGVPEDKYPELYEKLVSANA